MKVDMSKSSHSTKERELRWDEVWEDSLKTFGVSSKEARIRQQVIDAQKEWYLKGDLTPLIALPESLDKQDALALGEVVEFCPLTDIDAYLEFIKNYSNWLSENSLGYWSDYPGKEKRDAWFIKRFLMIYKGEHLDATKEIHEYMLKILMPDEYGRITFPFTLGNDNWQPSSEISLCTFGSDVLSILKRYLFSNVPKDRYKSHIKVFLPYVRYIKDLDIKYFDIVLLTEKPRRPAPEPTPRRVSRPGQLAIREAIGNLMGYNAREEDESELIHHDVKLEKELKELLDSISMPKEYYKLVEFIQNNPDSFMLDIEA